MARVESPIAEAQLFRLHSAMGIGGSVRNRRTASLATVAICLLVFIQTKITLHAATNSPVATPAEALELPKSVPDPLEPMNRVIWSFNEAAMTGVVKPTARVYRFIIRKPIRTSISNFGKNLTFPGRLINNILQARWTGARDESYRFFYNTTVGVVGFFDVATTKYHVPASEADFGQTFGRWGWDPHCFLMLPILGPSNERDTVGYIADTAANPLYYITPYDFEPDDPLTYFGPYTYFNYGVMYNNLSDTVDEYVRFSRAETDPYSEVQYAWTFARANRAPDFQVKGAQDQATLETIESIFFTFKDEEFPRRARTRSTLIPATGHKLKTTYWIQPGKADLVYIVPGLGSHRLAKAPLALAELAYKNGFSVVCVSSPFNSEFMEHASTAAMPAYLPTDAHDLHVALTEVDRDLNSVYPNRIGDRALMGYSMGAVESLYIASAEKETASSLLKFSRYVAIDAPVRMLNGVAKLDEFYQAPLEWPKTERTNNIQNTFLKVAALSKVPPSAETAPPFSAIESKFLVGIAFRLILRDIIFSSQQRHNQGVLQHPLKNLRRDPAYQEIINYSFHDYFEKFAIPYYQTRASNPQTADSIEKSGDLRTYEAALRANPNIRIVVNQNDFLLTPDDLAWLKSTFTKDQLTVFPRGGHLGNLGHPDVQERILKSLGNSR